jgi:tRNA threonylcarbamoyladenosine biosynthesis protein TsaE|tara:strand:- start:2137 stop:2610 length:474 start_codon:yes stop_codon:yes gene_type:complete
MKNIRLEVPDESAMLELGFNLGTVCPEGTVIYLRGNLGTGKTTLSRGFLQSYGYQGVVKSPTYTLVEPYQFNDRQVFHFDLYRLGNALELEYIGIRDYFNDNDICLIEWPDQGEGFLPPADLVVRIEPYQQGRELQLHGISDAGVEIIEAIKALVEK